MPLSIEIRLKKMLVVQTVITKNRIHAKKTCIVDLEDGWIDAKGITDPAAVSFALNKALVDNDIKEKRATLCINNPSIMYREINIPKVDDKRIPFMVRSEMIATMDLSADYIIDFIILDETTEAHKTQIRILAVAISEKALASYVNLFTKLDIKIDVIDTATSSVIKLINKTDVFDGDLPVIIADVEQDLLKLYLFENKKYILIRNTKLQEFEPTRKIEWIGDLEDNINKMVQYQFTRESHVGVKRIAFFGDHPLLQDISRSVSESLDVETMLLPKPDLLSSRDENFLPFLNAIGASLRK